MNNGVWGKTLVITEVLCFALVFLQLQMSTESVHGSVLFKTIHPLHTGAQTETQRNRHNIKHTHTHINAWVLVCLMTAEL